MKWVVKLLAGFFGGIVVYVVGIFFFTSLFLGVENAGAATTTGAFIVTGIALLMAITAPTGGKAWRRVFVLSSLLAFAMPLASFLSSVIGLAADPAQSGTATAGKVIGAGIVAAMTGFIGFFAGLIFALLAYFSGKDKQQVIVVERQA